jgi:hypothetical protein
MICLASSPIALVPSSLATGDARTPGRPGRSLPWRGQTLETDAKRSVTATATGRSVHLHLDLSGVDADGTAELEIQLTGLKTLTVDDFCL